MAKASFLLRPRWLASHVLVVALVVVMINLGFWQLDRLDQRRDRNEVISAREDQPTVPVEDLLAPDGGSVEVEDARFRSVSATGTYDAAGTVVVRNRTQDGAPGVWAVTPLVLETGEEVGIVRGFSGLGTDGEPDVPDPPGGEVAVTGTVADPEGFDGTAPGDVAPLVARDDVLPGVVMAESSVPADGGEGQFEPVAPPEEGEGPHLSYAVQWFIFSTIAVVGYPLVLRRVVQRRAGDADGLEREARVRVNGDRAGVEPTMDDSLPHG